MIPIFSLTPSSDSLFNVETTSQVSKKVIGKAKFTPFPLTECENLPSSVMVEISQMRQKGILEFSTLDVSISEVLNIDQESMGSQLTALKVSLFCELTLGKKVIPSSRFRLIPKSFLTEEICLMVSSNPYLLSFLPEKFLTPSVCDAFFEACCQTSSIKQNIQFFPSWYLTDEKLLVAFEHDINCFLLLPDSVKTQSMCLHVLDQIPEAIGRIPPQFLSEEICLQTMRRDPFVFQHIPDQFRSETICCEAVSHEPSFIQEISESLLTPKICLLAVQNQGSLISSIPERMRSKEICLASLAYNEFYSTYFPEKIEIDSSWAISILARWYQAKTSTWGELLHHHEMNFRKQNLRTLVISEAMSQAGIDSKFIKQILKISNLSTQDWILNIAFNHVDFSSAKLISEVITHVKSSLVIPLFLGRLLLKSDERFHHFKSLLNPYKMILKDRLNHSLDLLLELQVMLLDCPFDEERKFLSLLMVFSSLCSLYDLKLKISLISILLKIQPSFFFKHTTPITLENLKKQALTLLIDLDLIDTTIPDFENLFFEKFVTAFESRFPAAIFIYVTRCSDNPVLMESLRHFILSVLKDEFSSLRNESNHHRKYLSQAQKERWESSKILELEILPQRQAEFDPRAFLNEKILIDRHAPEIISLTREVLTNSLIERDGWEKKIQERLMALMICSQRDQIVALRNLLASLDQIPSLKDSQFHHDVSGCIQLLNRQQIQKQTLYLHDTSDYIDLLLCGTEIPGSCQSIESMSGLNSCLLGYILDGKIRLLALKNAQGKIISRAIIKLLIDEQNHPVLFLERCYPDTTFYEAILEMAKQKSKEMNISLYSQKGLVDEITLHSEGNPAPHEYEDGHRAGSGVTNGVYSIEGTCIFTPSS